jgi:hypothetical protein
MNCKEQADFKAFFQTNPRRKRSCAIEQDFRALTLREIQLEEFNAIG